MRDKRAYKRSGFSLMEIVLAIAIVAILALITIPIINKQVAKSDENSYYMAYRTVEKLAGQIVTLGDNEEDTSAMLQFDTKVAKDNNSFGKYLSDKYNQNVIKVKTYLSSLGQKFAYTELYVFKKLFPKTFATIITGEFTELEFSSDEYDEDWLIYQVCNGKQIPKAKKYKTVTTTNPDGSVTTRKVEDGFEYYTKDEVNCIGYTDNGTSGDTRHPHSALEKYIPGFLCNSNATSSSSASANVIATRIGKTMWFDQPDRPDASAACSVISSLCSSGPVNNGGTELSLKDAPHFIEAATDDDGDEDDDDGGETGTSDDSSEFVPPPASVKSGKCIATSEYRKEISNSSAITPEADLVSFSDEDCIKRGYINAYNKPGNGANYLECVCNPGLVPSDNDEKACVAPCSDGSSTYAKVHPLRTTATSVCCKTDFNDQTGTCCPDHSMYTGSRVCQCMNGYAMNSAGECKVSQCAPGSTLTDDSLTGEKVCVANASLVKASSFCSKVTEHWNISSSSCSASGFTELDGAHYNSNVFNAAKGTNGTYLSINSKTGAFNSITPNIVFSNGLKMWILGDRSASIPGLSTTTKDVSGIQNDCKSIKNKTNATSCSNADGYFCAGENRCYTLADKTNATVVDARNCCASVNMTDYAQAAQNTGNDEAYQQVSAAYAISGFTIFIDINGDKGSGTLWEDVYPFYITTNGTVYPGYPIDAPKAAKDAAGNPIGQSTYLGGNSEKQLPVDVYYYKSYDGTKRKKVMAFPNVSFARAVCSARKVSKYTPYCLNLGERYKGVDIDGNTLSGNSYIMTDDSTSKNPCDKYPCYVTVRKKLSAF